MNHSISYTAINSKKLNPLRDNPCRYIKYLNMRIMTLKKKAKRITEPTGETFEEIQRIYKLIKELKIKLKNTN